MNALVTIRFSPDVTFEIRVPYVSDAEAKAQARDWLDRTYEEFGCEPTRLLGKVIILDKVLGIAEAAGERHFQKDQAWGESYAKAVSCALDRTSVRVDLEDSTVSS